MDRLNEELPNSSDSLGGTQRIISGTHYGLTLAYALLQFLALEGVAVYRLVRSAEGSSRGDLFHLAVTEMFVPLMIFLLATLAYRKIKIVLV